MALLGRDGSWTTSAIGATMNQSDIRGLGTARLTFVGGGLALHADVMPFGQSMVQGWDEDSPVSHLTDVAQLPSASFVFVILLRPTSAGSPGLRQQLLFAGDRPHESGQLADQGRHRLLLVLTATHQTHVPPMQPRLRLPRDRP